VYVGGLIVMSSGDGSGARYMVAVDPEGREPTKVWDLNTKDVLPYVPCFLVKDERLYWIGDKAGGWACCADPRTGKILFSERATTKEPSSSPVMVGDEIMMVAEDGEVVVFKAAKEYDEVARVKLGEAVFASPAVADGKLFIRGMKHLYCFGKK
jgi:hypothetical protein